MAKSYDRRSATRSHTLPHSIVKLNMSKKWDTNTNPATAPLKRLFRRILLFINNWSHSLRQFT